MSTSKRRGRPPLDDASRVTTKITLRVTAAQRLDLRRVASGQRGGMSGIIREAVNEYVADYGERSPFLRRK